MSKLENKLKKIIETFNNVNREIAFKDIKKLSEKYSVSENAILLSWILKHPANISPVIGTTNKKRIKSANEALNVTLELEDWFMLLTESQGHKVP